ncbi:hypothetical protein [Erysipelothrix aquatica]|nr:hypothetical protein [Erysipelothrix aquatica]
MNGIEGLYPSVDEYVLRKYVENTLSQQNAAIDSLIPLAPFWMQKRLNQF